MFLTIRCLLLSLIFSLILSQDASLQIIPVDWGKFEVWLANEVPVSGIQINIDDNPDYYTFSYVEGVDEGEVFAWIGSENEGGITLLGFSFTGETIDEGGYRPIVYVEVDGEHEDNFDMCISSATLSDMNAEAISTDYESCISDWWDDWGLENEQEEVPNQFSLDFAYPNPFNPTTMINWKMEHAANYSIDVYNAKGQLVDVISKSFGHAGYHSAQWNADGQSSGIYFVKMLVDGKFINSQKLMLVK